MSIYKEFEIKFLLDPYYKESPFTKDSFMKSIESLINRIIYEEPKIYNRIELNNTINFIKTINTDNSDILEVKYESGSKYTKNKYNKKTINKYFGKNDGISFKSTLSEETQMKEDTIDMNLLSIIRGKMRITMYFNTNVLKDWKLDITFITMCSPKYGLECVKKIKESLFKTYDIKLLKNNINWNIIDLVEIELEYVGDQSKINNLLYKLQMDEITKIFIQDKYIFNTVQYDSKLHELAYIINKKSKTLSFKSIVNNVKNLTNKTYYQNILINLENYFVTLKLNGERVILIYDTKLYIVTNKDIKIDDKFVSKDNTIKYFILDCELYEDKYFIFDIIMVNNNNYSVNPFSERYILLKQISNKISYPNLIPKDYYKLNYQNYCEIIRKTYTESKYTIDGLIFTQSNANYNYTNNYKWKPIEELSIDFIIVKCPNEILGQKPYINKEGKTLYLLFVGVNDYVYKNYHLQVINCYDSIFPSTNKDYFPIQFSPLNYPYAYLCWLNEKDLHMKYVEMVYDKKNREWKLLKIRTDKKISISKGIDIGNNYDVACEIWYNYEYPLTLDGLCMKKEEFEDNIYFVKTSDSQTSVRKFNRFMTDKLLRPNKNKMNTNWVIDIGIGRGADIGRYIRYGYKYILGIDKDIEALKELIARYKKYTINNPTSFTQLYIQQSDLSQCAGLLEQIEMFGIILPKSGVDLVYCNFAFHYFLYNESTLDNVLCFIGNALKSGGKFIFTAFDGEKLFEKLKDVKILEYKNLDNKIEYAVKKKYEQSTIQNIGQLIDVLQPFSMNKYYSEPLVNISYIKIVAKKHKLELQDKGISFGAHINEYIQYLKDKNMDNLMTNHEKEYLSLYHYYVFIKK